MSQEWKLSFTCALLALFCLGCSTEKAPPLVHWISPQSAATVDEGDALGLKFSITDPAPSRGETEAASWRVTIGTESGTTWWTTSGILSAAPEAAVVTATIETTWQVPTSLAGSSGPIDLQLSAVCTDGEGQTGADFAALTLNSMPLTSSGLWWDNGTNSLGFVNPQANTNANFYPGPNSPHEMVYLDGEDLLVCGTTEAQGWLLTNGVPATEPVWSITPSPPNAVELELRPISDIVSGYTWRSYLPGSPGVGRTQIASEQGLGAVPTTPITPGCHKYAHLGCRFVGLWEAKIQRSAMERRLPFEFASKRSERYSAVDLVQHRA